MSTAIAVPAAIFFTDLFSGLAESYTFGGCVAVVAIFGVFGFTNGTFFEAVFSAFLAILARSGGQPHNAVVFVASTCLLVVIVDTPGFAFFALRVGACERRTLSFGADILCAITVLGVCVDFVAAFIVEDAVAVFAGVFGWLALADFFVFFARSRVRTGGETLVVIASFVFLADDGVFAFAPESAVAACALSFGTDGIEAFGGACFGRTWLTCDTDGIEADGFATRTVAVLCTVNTAFCACAVAVCWTVFVCPTNAFVIDAFFGGTGIGLALFVIETGDAFS